MKADRVFISYSTEDVSQAVRIKNILEQKGIDCWFAPENINSGDWAAKITKAIENADVFLLLISKNSMKSAQVSREVGLALANPRIKTVPVFLKDCEMNERATYLVAGEQRLYYDRAGFTEDLLQAVQEKLGMPVSANKVPQNRNHATEIKPHTWRTYASNKKLVAFIIIAVAIADLILLGVYNMTSGKNQSANDDKTQIASQEVAEEDVDVVNSNQGETTTDVTVTKKDTTHEGYVKAPEDFVPFSKYCLINEDYDYEKTINLAGQEYAAGFLVNNNILSDTFIGFANTKDYKYFRCMIGIRGGSGVDNTKDNYVVKTTVEVDGEEYDNFTMKPSDRPREIVIDVSAAKQVLIRVDGSTEVTVADVLFYNDEGVKYTSDAIHLDKDSVTLDEKEPYATGSLSYVINKRTREEQTRIFLGEEKDTFVCVGINDQAALFSNDDGYKSVTFTVGRDDGQRLTGKCEIQIDGEKYDAFVFDGSEIPKTITLDISDSYCIGFFGESFYIYDMIWEK